MDDENGLVQLDVVTAAEGWEEKHTALLHRFLAKCKLLHTLSKFPARIFEG